MENNINESVLDPVQKTRCEAVFDIKTEKMKPEVKKFILGILDKFKQDTKLDFEYTSVFMIGSSTGFQYTDTSDIDINARVSLPRSAFNGKFSMIPKGIILPNTQKPVNIFVSFSDDDEYNPDYAENIYNILTDNWDKQSTLEKSEIPYSYVAGLATFFMDGCDLMFGKYERDKKELQKYMEFDPNKIAITEKEKDEAINRKIVDIQNDADALKMAHHFMFSFDNESFGGNPFIVSINYKFKDPHYAMNNLIYKYIDSFGYYERINQIQKEAKELVKKAKDEIKKNSADHTVEGENKKDVQQEIKNKTLKESKNSEQQSEEDNEQYIVINSDGSRSIVHSREECEKRQAEEDAKKSKAMPVKHEEVESQPSDVDAEEVTERPSELSDTETRENEKNKTVATMSGRKVKETINEDFALLLKNNGFEPSERNIRLLKEGIDSGKYIIIGGYGNGLDESLQSRTERYMNKRIVKTSGKWSGGVAGALGFLFSGIIGTIIGVQITSAHNAKLDDAEAELYDEVKNDPDCMEIISKIKEEVHSSNPDKQKLKSLKKEYTAAVKQCHSRLKSEHAKWNEKPYISLNKDED